MDEYLFFLSDSGVSRRGALCSERINLSDFSYAPKRCSILVTWMVGSLVERGVVHVLS